MRENQGRECDTKLRSEEQKTGSLGEGAVFRDCTLCSLLLPFYFIFFLACHISKIRSTLVSLIILLAKQMSMQFLQRRAPLTLERWGEMVYLLIIDVVDKNIKSNLNKNTPGKYVLDLDTFLNILDHTSTFAMLKYLCRCHYGMNIKVFLRILTWLLNSSRSSDKKYSCGFKICYCIFKKAMFLEGHCFL